MNPRPGDISPYALVQAAEDAAECGVSFTPPTEDGVKAPSPDDRFAPTPWNHLRERLPTQVEIERWYEEDGRLGIGFVCGKISGNLEALDFDDAETYERFMERADEFGIGELVRSIHEGYASRSPSGGVHLLYRCSAIAGNLKLAMRPNPTEADPHVLDTLLETRGEGGFIIEPPSHGPVHPSGLPYVQLAGGVASIPTITPEERDAVLSLARSFDERPKPEFKPESRPRRRRAEGDEILPGDDFAERTSWEDVLVGWTMVFQRGETTYWRRPGKERGVSATTNHGGGGCLHVFTTSSTFEVGASYSKFGAYAALEHGGDFTAAARSLAERGYGKKPERPKKERKPRADYRRKGDAEGRPPVEAEPREDQGGEGSGLPQIITGFEDTDEGFKRWTSAGLDAIAAANRASRDPVIYQRGARLVRVRKVDEGGDEASGISIDPLGVDAIRGVLDRCANWGTPYYTNKGEMRIKWGPPRKDIAVDANSMSDYGGRFPVLHVVADSPRFLPDGTLVLDPGYHEKGRLYYSPTPELLGLDVPEIPTDEEVDRAKSLIVDDLLCDFTFANHASKANAVALMLLPFARLMVHGSTPLHHAEASTEGTGKGLLIQACLLPSCGADLASTPPKEDDTEWRKILTTHFAGGSPYLFLDNVANFYDRFTGDILPVDSPSLAQALTTRVYKDRKLRSSESVDVAVKSVFVSTGNNTEWSRELNRRLVLMQLVSTCEDPSSRTNFRHPDLMDWAKRNRRELVRACLILIRRWISVGQPQGKQVFGSFDAYAKTMGGILDAIGIEGFLGNRRVGGKDREAAMLSLLTARWFDTHGTTPVRAKDVLAVVDSWVPLAEAMADTLRDGKEGSRSKRTSHLIRRNLNRVCGEWRIVEAGKDRHKCIGLYRLQNPSIPVESEYDDPSPPDNADSGVPF